MASDVQITVYNKTRDFQNIVIFQQADDLNQMFDKLFPIAWKVFPLNGVRDGVERKGYTVYPVKQTIGVTRNPISRDKLPFGTLDITAKADNSEQFKYYLDHNGGQEIDKLDGKNDDSSISCENDADELASIAFAKNGSTLVVQQDVAKGDKAVFKLTPKIYIMYLNNIKEGDIFKAMQTGANVKEVDLTGYTSIEATLGYTNGPGQEKGWEVIPR
ncbi:MAG: hypothetical protein RMY29_018510 [Nostoc sp. CreGUA01]|nr:hypothetical protein [Nostoc sp. CreGUA01]